jgi:ketosteroid isomerase-like protein
MRCFSLFLLLSLIASCTNPEDIKNGRNSIKSLMNNQQAAWNNGDIEGFMKAYWKSDSLVFIGSRGLTYGWETVLSNYRKSYPDQAAMGKLSFNNRLIREIDNNHFWVAGQWKLYRETDTISGHYTLVWKRINGQWRIISDHSS